MASVAKILRVATYPILGPLIVAGLAMCTVFTLEGGDGDQHVFLGAIGFMFASPIAYLVLLFGGLVAVASTPSSSLCGPFFVGISVTSIFAFLSFFGWSTLPIEEMSYSVEQNLFLIPVGSAIALVSCVPTYLIWFLAERKLQKRSLESNA